MAAAKVTPRQMVLGIKIVPPARWAARWHTLSTPVVCSTNADGGRETADRRPGNGVFLQKFCQRRLQTLLRRASPAANSQGDRPGDQVQGSGKGPLLHGGRNGDSKLPRALCQAIRQFSRNGIRRGNANGLILQKCCGHGLGQLPAGDNQILRLCPHIHGKLPPNIRCGGNHGLSAGHSGNPAGQIIGPAHMARQQRNCKPPRFIHGHHGGIRELILDKRRNGTDGNAGGRHKNQRPAVRKPLPGPVRQAARSGKPQLTGQPSRRPQPSAQTFGQLISQFTARPGECNDGNHREASRQPWEKPGS